VKEQRISISKIIVLVIGSVAALLGVLWFLQGSDILHIKPILCFGNCEPIIGLSTQWQINGIIAVVIGAAMIWWSIRKGLRKK
jgi:hypothetical protein